MAAGSGTGTRPTGEKGQQGYTQGIGSLPGTPGWGRFVQTDEYVPDLRWPQSVMWFERMLYTDSQLEALYLGTTLPITQYHWALDPNGADTAWTELLAEDLGLPIGLPPSDEEEQDILPGAYAFSFADHLQEALLAVPLGHYYFERVGEVDDQLRWRLRKLGPLAPATVDQIFVSRQGDLEAVTQRGGLVVTTQGPTWYAGLREPLEAARLCTYVWRGDARARWIGRPMLRSAYRHWLVKDMLIRVDAVNHEKAGGVPTIETDDTYQGTDLKDLQAMAAAWRVGEDSGAALPPGAKMVLKAIQGGDVVQSMEYHDNLMARSWQNMVLQLGQGGAGGNRALGGTLAGVQDSAQQAIAKWFRGNFNLGVIRAWWENNVPRTATGALPPHPLLVCRRRNSAVPLGPPKVEPGASATPALGPEQNPPAPPGPETPGQGSPGTPGTSDVVARSRRDPPMAPAQPPVARSATTTRAVGPMPRPAGIPSQPMLPARPLRRDPYPHEIAAATDFATIDRLHEATHAAAVKLFEQEWLPALMEQVRAQIVALGDSPTPDALAALTLTPPDAGGLHDVLMAVARKSADEAGAELAAQGVTVGVADEARIEALIAGQAEAMAQQVTDGIRLAATRRAVQLANPAVPTTADDIAAGVTDYLGGLVHDWESRQLRGAVQQALTAGRFARFELIRKADKASYYVSALLDVNTCDPCANDDGTEFGSIDEALAFFPSGANPDCEGGPNCRCTCVAVAGSEV